MKKLVFATLMLVFGPAMAMAYNPVESVAQKLRIRIIDLLGDSEIEFEKQHDSGGVGLHC